MGLRLRVGTVMKQKGITVSGLKAFSKKAGIAMGTARNLYFEATIRADMPVIEKVAKALGVSPLELFEEMPDVEEGNSRPIPLATLQLGMG